MKTKLLVIAALALGGSLSAQIVNYLESVSGDLSSSGAAPTFLNFDLGQNKVSGTMGRPNRNVAVDADIFTFTVNPGEWITSINILTFSPVAAPGPVGSFFAISGSSTINQTNPSTHLSNRLITGTGEILPLLAAGSFSDTVGQPATLGLTAPLGAGNYTIWFQELSTNVDYTIGVTLSAVPEPSTYAWGGAAALLGCVAVRRWRRANGAS